jgi:hypothetical protein
MSHEVLRQVVCKHRICTNKQSEIGYGSRMAEPKVKKHLRNNLEVVSDRTVAFRRPCGWMTWPSAKAVSYGRAEGD